MLSRSTFRTSSIITFLWINQIMQMLHGFSISSSIKFLCWKLIQLLLQLSSFSSSFFGSLYSPQILWKVGRLMYRGNVNSLWWVTLLQEELYSIERKFPAFWWWECPFFLTGRWNRNNSITLFVNTLITFQDL